jgi:4a-hydroxytetrahydrobiopterin dehydratase
MPERLREKHCTPCERGTPPLSPQETGLLAQDVPEWKLDQGKLVRKLKFRDFREAMAFVNRVAALAEEEGHHPDIQISYNRVTFELWTHAINGLSENDFILAAKIEALLSQ